MKQTSDHYKNMKHRMKILFLFSDPVENCADRVADASEDQKSHSAFSDGIKNYRKNRRDTPADRDIKHHSENLELFKVDRSQRYAEDRKTPDYPEISPAQRGTVLPQNTKRKWGVSSCDKQKYRAVIQNSENFFRFKIRV